MKSQRCCVLVISCLLTVNASTLGLQGATAKVSFSTTPQRPRPGDKVKEIAIGAAAPNWRLKTVEGETVALSELRGKVVVLDFWANRCGPCHKLTPLFDQLVGEYQRQPVKFFTLSIWPNQEFNPQVL